MQKPKTAASFTRRPTLYKRPTDEGWQTSLYNSDGLLYTYDLKPTPDAVEYRLIIANNNDHVISFDGKWLAISSGLAKFHVFRLGNDNRRRAEKINARRLYMHGWSPTVNGSFCGERNSEFDVYTIPVEGGEEARLTTAPGLDDGPEYSPDGKYIYFNSVRSGLMQIWRMKPDGSDQEQVTSDDYNNWFAHPSPDGKWIVFLSFPKVTASGNILSINTFTSGLCRLTAALKSCCLPVRRARHHQYPIMVARQQALAFISNTSLLFPIFPTSK
jgi:tricorn protease-like protein